MKTLDDAWEWYLATRDGARRLVRLARYWDRLPSDPGTAGVDEINRDEFLRTLPADRMGRDAERALGGLDDLAVLVLFGVFEAVVREQLAERVQPEVAGLRDPTLRKAGEDVLDAIAQGSFGRLLDPYKSPVGAEVVEQVNQVRRYRNWVAHGTRPELRPDVTISPRAAYDRLGRFLAAFRGPNPSPA